MMSTESEVCDDGTNPFRVVFQWMIRTSPNYLSIGPPRSRNFNFTIQNQNAVDIIVIPPSGPRVTVAPQEMYGPSGTIGAHQVVAPGNPDVTYFKVHWDFAMSTENGPLSGNFAVTINMIWTNVGMFLSTGSLSRSLLICFLRIWWLRL